MTGRSTADSMGPAVIHVLKQWQDGRSTHIFPQIGALSEHETTERKWIGI